MGKYPEIDLNLTKPEIERMELVASKKLDGLKHMIGEYINKNDMSFVVYSTVASGATLGQLYDSIHSARVDIKRSYPHEYQVNILTNPVVQEVLDMTRSGELEKLKDEELIIASSHAMVLLRSCKACIEVLAGAINSTEGGLLNILAEMGKRGTIPIRAVLQPLKMGVKYQVVTDTETLIVSYDEQLVFELQRGGDVKACTFIGNVQSDGEVHHLSNMPLFSTQTQLLFGTIGTIVEPMFLSGRVLSIVELNQVN